MVRDYTKFYTPNREAVDLINLAELTSECTLLEPSAGSGNIAKQVHVRRPHLPITAVEVNDSGLAYLHTLSNVKVVKSDFLDYPVTNKFDRVIANPPFTNDIWFLHLLKMYEHLNDNGILVCIVPVFPIMKYNSYVGLAMATLKEWHPNELTTHPMKNWATNSNGSVTEIEVIKWRRNAVS